MDVSIIITNYNYGIFLERCLRSCLNQHLPRGKYEVIVVDDASTDMSQKILTAYKDKVRTIFLSKNEGVGFASNEGIRAAEGQFVVRVDADDYINEYMILTQLLFLRNRSDYFGVSVDYMLVTSEGDKKTSLVSAVDEPISCGIMYRKDILVREGLYNPKYRHREERELRLRLNEKYKIGNIPIPFYRYRQHDKNKSKSEEFHEIEQELTVQYIQTTGARKNG